MVAMNSRETALSGHSQTRNIAFKIAVGVSTLLLIARFGLAVLLPADATAPGTLDTTFGTNGFASLQNGPYDQVNSVAVDGAGRIVAAIRYSRSGGGVGAFVVARFTSNGQLDTTFGTGGYARANLGADDQAMALTLDSSGRIIAGGSAQINGIPVFAICAFSSSGILDATFGSNGCNTHSPGNSGDGIASLAIDSHSRIVAGGLFNDTCGYSTCENFGLARYLPSGQLDTSFGAGGFVTSAPDVGANFYSDALSSLAITSNDAIVVAGSINSGDVVGEFDATGALVNSFGGSGNGFNVWTPNGNSSFTSVRIDSSGRIIAAGTDDNAGHFQVARYTSNGVLDTSFGTNGYVSSNLGTFTQLSAILIDGAGNIITGGYSCSGVLGNCPTSFLVARYTPNGALDSNFGTNGFNATPMGTNDSVSALAFSPTGDIIAAGTITINGTPNYGFARYSDSLIVAPPSPTPTPSVTPSPTPTPTPSVTPTPSPTPTPPLPPALPPLQQSAITGISVSDVPTSNVTHVILTGHFMERVAAIRLNLEKIPSTNWSQTSTTISINLIGLQAGSYQLQVYDGSAPLLTEQDFNYAPTTPPSSLPGSSTNVTTDSSSNQSQLVQFDAPAIFFPSDSSILTNTDESILRNLLLQIHAMKVQKISVNGYNDYRESIHQDTSLAEIRAETVLTYLVQHGLTAPITATGVGLPQTPEAQARSGRRADITVVIQP